MDSENWGCKSLGVLSPFHQPYPSDHCKHESLHHHHHQAGNLIAQLVKNLPSMQETPVQFLVGKIPWRRDRPPTPVFLGLPCGSAGKESACNAGDLGSIPRLGRSPGEGQGYPLQCSGLENPMDYTVHGVAKRQTRLSGFHFHCLLFGEHWHC